MRILLNILSILGLPPRKLILVIGKQNLESRKLGQHPYPTPYSTNSAYSSYEPSAEFRYRWTAYGSKQPKDSILRTRNTATVTNKMRRSLVLRSASFPSV
jgi:hypothetical protein